MYMQSQNVHGLPILSSVMTRVKKANWKDSNPVSYKYLQQWTTEAPSLNLISHAVCEASCQALSLSLSLSFPGGKKEREGEACLLLTVNSNITINTPGPHLCLKGEKTLMTREITR